MADEENKETKEGTTDNQDNQVTSEQANDSLDAVIGAYVNTAKQLPGVIPELITGKTLNEVNASIDLAKAAYTRTKEQLSAAVSPPPANAAPVMVGTGAAAAGASGEAAKLSTNGGFEKILAAVEKGRGGQSR